MRVSSNPVGLRQFVPRAQAPMNHGRHTRQARDVDSVRIRRQELQLLNINHLQGNPGPIGSLMVTPVFVSLLAHNLSHTGDHIQSEWDECAAALLRDVCRRERASTDPAAFSMGGHAIGSTTQRPTTRRVTITSWFRMEI
ncbi:hypothetical protein PG996_009225 [Apiospora saccharicola]|uniref:Uncharacterized protein n=1 Tax=Apiospora saccharicola TaxID=335842 RepID=A0ABR1UK54_9PEZI